MSLAALAAAALIPPLAECPPDPRPAPVSDGGRAAPGADALGDVWEMEEVSCWRGTWLRRGKTRKFDAYWIKPDGSRERATLEMWLVDRSVVVARHHGQGKYCRYDGVIAPDGRHVDGRYTCTWNRTPMHWSARIIWMERPPPNC